MATALPRRPLTVEDLAELPDDDHRYELIDGSLLVTPAPGTAHQLALGRLHTLLSTTMMGGLVAILAPYDYVITPTTVLEPDLLVVRAEQLTGDKLTSTPRLVVEVLSPSTRRTDLGSKRLAYQDAGVPAYWILDPATAVLTVHHLDTGGTYQATIVTPPGSWADPDLGVTIDPGVLCQPAV
jgi:Uma2 family endonuclease